VTGSNLSGTNTGDQTITLTGGVTGSGTGSFAATVVTNANLTGDVTSSGNATTLTNAPVIAKVLTGYTSGAGTVAATDSILQAIQKLNGNDATNANLTGVITSVGNATSIASQTGTGTKFVVDTSPVLVTPNIGVATGTSLAAALNGSLGATTPSTIAATTVGATGLITASANGQGISCASADANGSYLGFRKSGTTYIGAIGAATQSAGVGTVNDVAVDVGGANHVYITTAQTIRGDFTAAGLAITGALSATSTSATQALFSGFDSVGGANTQNGSISLGTNSVAQGILHYHASSGNTVLYVDNSYDNAAAAVTIRTRTLGTPVSVATFTGAGAAITGTLSATGQITSTVASGTVTLESTAPYGTGYKAIRLGNTGSTLTVGVESSAGGSLLTSATGYAGVVSSNSTILQLGASNTIVATLSSGALAVTGDISASSLGTQLSLTRTAVATNTLRVGGSKELIVAVDGTDRASFTTTGLAVTGTISASSTFNTSAGVAGFTISSDGGNTPGIFSPSGKGFYIGTNLSLSTGLFVSTNGSLILNAQSNSPAASAEYLTIKYDPATRTGLAIQATTNNYATNAVLFYGHTSAFAGSIQITATNTIAVVTSSDSRLKKNVRDMSDSGSIIDATLPRIFDWNWSDTDEQGRGKDVHGFIAQELYQAFPEAVSVGGDNADKTPWCVDYSKIVPVLVAELKSLRKRLAALESK